MFFRGRNEKEIEKALTKTVEKSTQLSLLLLSTFVELAEKQVAGQITTVENEQLNNPFIIFDSVLNHKAGGLLYALAPAGEFSLLELEMRVYAVKLTIKSFVGYPFDKTSEELYKLSKEFKAPKDTVDRLLSHLKLILDREVVPESSLYVGYPKDAWELISVVSKREFSRSESPSPTPPLRLLGESF